MKLTGILDGIEAFHKPNVRMKHPDKVAEMVQQLTQDGDKKLQVILDFDHTLTRVHENGTKCECTWEILDHSELMPQFYRDETTRLRDIYYPIEIDPHMTIEEKIPKAVEWYTQAHNIMLRTGIKKQDIWTMVKTSSAKLRDGTDRMLSRLNELGVPVLIFSAGLGDLIHAVLDIHSRNYDNVKVVSNYMKFNEEGAMVGFHDKMIHMYNKNENSVHSSDYFDLLTGRGNVILMGDNVGDVRMADGVNNPNVVLKIGFLNHHGEERVAKFLEFFDIVLVDDQSMDLGNEIIDKLA